MSATANCPICGATLTPTYDLFDHLWDAHTTATIIAIAVVAWFLMGVLR